MGWTGRPMWYNPKGDERVRLAIEDNLDNERVVDTAVSGNNIYVAYKLNGNVIGVVIMTQFAHHEFLTKAISEDCGPFAYDCPKRILDKLSPTEVEYASEWREKCRKRLEEKRRKASEKRAKAKEFNEHFKAVFGTYPR